MEDKIKNIMATVFEIPVSEINDNSSVDTIESWDSLKHMKLVVVLEEEFQIEIPDEELGNITTYPLIKLVLEEVLANKVSN